MPAAEHNQIFVIHAAHLALADCAMMRGDLIDKLGADGA